MGKRFVVDVDTGLIKDDRESDRQFKVPDQGERIDLTVLLNELWETAFIASQSVTVTKILSAIVTSNKQVLIPFTLHEKMAMIIKALGGPDKAEEFFSELEDSTTIK